MTQSMPVTTKNIDHILAVEPRDSTGQSHEAPCHFIGQPRHHTDNQYSVLYGGLLLGQATHAAQIHGQQRYGDRFNLHSFHCYFLRRAAADKAVDYQVNVLRRGGKFSASQITCRQDDRLLMNFNASFHSGESGESHQLSMPEVNPPADRNAVSPLHCDLRQLKFGEKAIRFSMPMPVWIDPVSSYIKTTNGQATLNCWMRTMHPVENTYLNQVNALAYLSDYCTMSTVAYAQDHPPDTDLFVVSLDHAMWFYHTPQTQQWHLYSIDSSLSGRGRGLCTGRIYGQDGTLWAAFAQEGLLRLNQTIQQPSTEVIQ